ncbi:unnamed protein product [Rotaria sp. Silwood2]|nr:unnamed protein product [Rotaria sp. Silwood2]
MLPSRSPFDKIQRNMLSMSSEGCLLNTALHYVSVSKNAAQAMANADGKNKHYYLPIVGILAGARWGIPVETYKDNINDAQLITLRETCTKLSTTWKQKLDQPYN